MDCSLPGSSVHGILQARMLEWVACPPPSQPRSSALQGDSLLSEPPGNSQILFNKFTALDPYQFNQHCKCSSKKAFGSLSITVETFMNIKLIHLKKVNSETSIICSDL